MLLGSVVLHTVLTKDPTTSQTKANIRRVIFFAQIQHINSAGTSDHFFGRTNTHVMRLLWRHMALRKHSEHSMTEAREKRGKTNLQFHF